MMNYFRVNIHTREKIYQDKETHLHEMKIQAWYTQCLQISRGFNDFRFKMDSHHFLITYADGFSIYSYIIALMGTVSRKTLTLGLNLDWKVEILQVSSCVLPTLISWFQVTSSTRQIHLISVISPDFISISHWFHGWMVRDFSKWIVPRIYVLYCTHFSRNNYFCRKTKITNRVAVPKNDPGTCECPLLCKQGNKYCFFFCFVSLIPTRNIINTPSWFRVQYPTLNI